MTPVTPTAAEELPGVLELVLGNDEIIRLSARNEKAVGELYRGKHCVARAQFANFAALGRWADAVIRRARVGPRVSCDRCDD